MPSSAIAEASHRRGESGAVFGIPLSQCVSQHEHPAAATATAGTTVPGAGSASSSAGLAAASFSSGGGAGSTGLGSFGLSRRKRSTASGKRRLLASGNMIRIRLREVVSLRQAGRALDLKPSGRLKLLFAEAPMSHAHRASYGSISDTYRPGIPSSGGIGAHYMGAGGSTYTSAGSGGSSGGPYHSAGSGHSERVRGNPHCAYRYQTYCAGP